MNTTITEGAMENRASKRFTVFIMIMTVFAVAFAFINSLMPAEVSQGESTGVLAFIIRTLEPLGIQAELTDHLIRKAAHFTEFTVIGSLYSLCGYCFFRSKPFHYLPQVLFAGLLTALTDETIQLYAEGRSGMITDVWLDFAGIATGAVAAALLLSLYIKRKYRKKGKNNEYGSKKRK